jgi:Uncharacterized protein predicted to be involved in DNA repair (RAMP superfamily)
MNYTIYRLDCLTNLHMGGSDANYDVIDLQVERDPVLEEPTMNASGVKGALRDHCEVNAPGRQEEITEIFGTKNGGAQQGSYVFFGGDLLARPVRVSDGDSAWILASTPDMIGSFVNKLRALGMEIKGKLPSVEESGIVKVSCRCEMIEGLKTTPLSDEEKSAYRPIMHFLLGTDQYAIMSSNMLRAIALPVVAHNVLKDGQSKNLWYEEYVPHKSVFGLIVGRPGKKDTFNEIIGAAPVVQFGAEASTGCGYVRMSKIYPHGGKAQ